MRWSTIIEAQDEEQWFNSYVREFLAHKPASLPDEYQKIGNTETLWWECIPGIAFIHHEGGTLDDIALARNVVKAQLEGHGYRIASYTFEDDDPMRKTADWNDVQAKAARLLRAGNVQILRNGPNNIVGKVEGDHGNYDVEIWRDDPNSNAISHWSCTCPWSQFAWQRTRQWKKFEGRCCAHCLATYWKSRGTPIDEDIHPATQFGQAPVGQQPPAAGQNTFMPTQFGYPQAQPTGQAPETGGAPPIGQIYPGYGPMAPADVNLQQMQNSIIPPFPMAVDPNAVVPNPASVPGLKQPSPTNPTQFPGGTFSSVKESALVNGDIVMTKVDDEGTLIGRSDPHGSGNKIRIPKNSIGEVLGTDPVTGMINILFENKMTENMGNLQPNGVVAWMFPSEITPRPDIRRPGPAIRRRG